MGDFLSIFVFGLSLGMILFLLAAGLTLTMGLMRIINLAHGALHGRRLRGAVRSGARP
jgi:branched-subunit amino acid ABC-type transport system permease component